MNRTREILSPTEALTLIANTLNNPSIKHERIEMRAVYEATAEALRGRAHKPLTITKRGVVLEGLVDVLAAIHAWKPVPFDIARGAKGTRVYDRRGAKKAKRFDPRAIEKEVSSRVRELRLQANGNA